jgi:glycerol kinase
MQRQSDLLNMPVLVSREPDMTALGAAYLAAIGAGQMTTRDVVAIKQDADIYEPSMGTDERTDLWAKWQTSVHDVCKRIKA